MRLLTESRQGHRNTVRVLFYGQSITAQNWAQEVERSLRTRFPQADLVVENRALGGYPAQLLVKTAETDLYSFYPDLLDLPRLRSARQIRGHHPPCSRADDGRDPDPDGSPHDLDEELTEERDPARVSMDKSPGAPS